MRKIIFYINLCLLLLGGGNSLFAETQHTINYSFNQNLPERQQIKLKNTVPASTLIESTDIDLDEEFHNSDEFGGATKQLVAKNTLSNTWYLAFSSEPITKDYSNRIKIFAPFCGYSNPIYIRQQVLRI
ncbi:hypothetical protein [Flavobacterium eburneipallidum]|uniref:hypothetical protein n=1 Tax=Flavobacterium eburneipallidum TaxID=3003263 RepID=UPI0022AC7253|nr:hypothetical protein [Flavobacterium eburneipallidum]